MATRIKTPKTIPLDEHGQPKNRIYNKRRREDRSIDELIGLSRGLLVDHILTETEVDYLCTWLNNNKEHTAIYPFNVLSHRIANFLSDGIIDDKEREELFGLLQQIIGGGITEVLNLTATLPYDVPPPEMHFENKCFCLTGRFSYGTRNNCAKEIIHRGGKVMPNIMQATDYLIVGLFGSEDWIHASFGRKIETALKMREKGHQIYIVPEEHWIQNL